MQPSSLILNQYDPWDVTFRTGELWYQYVAVRWQLVYSTFMTLMAGLLDPFDQDRITP